MFQPKYQVNTTLLNNLVKIKTVINELNNQKFPELALARFEKDSYAISSFASTSIEGNPIPLTDVRKILKNSPAHVRDTEKEILNYNKALLYLGALLPKPKPITNAFICETQSIVVDGLIEKKNIGKYRGDPVIVNDPRKRAIAYIPPNAVDINPFMNELIDYLKKEYDTTDPLILAGIFHKQFVVIHPFMDGNGRTARLVTKYLLARMGLGTFRLFSFENYYNQNVSKYFSSVGVLGDYYEIVEKIDFTDWLVYFTDGIIDELLRVEKLLKEAVPASRLSEYEKDIVEYIKKNGSISISEYAKITNRAHSTQILDFKRLVDKNVIAKQGKGKATYYTLIADSESGAHSL
ncbi:MAG: Fic family protein [Candidatus Parcubacteria bacterium]|nr:Fic family protein [Candidatus Parcubacteria bacterium]